MAAQTILIAEDNPDIRDGVRILLAGEGYHILEAENGTRALEIFNPEVDLVILDIMMPGMSGLRVCEELRKVSTVPILFLTAKSQESDKLLGLTAGGDDYLPKPFSFAELSARVKALLRRYCVYQGKGQVASALVCILLYFALLFATRAGLSYYNNHSDIQQRSIARQVERFQKYVTEQEISAKDTRAIDEWVGQQSFLLMNIYRGHRMLYSNFSFSFGDGPDEEREPGSNFSFSFGDGSDEERESGESWQVFYPVQFSDGPAQVQLFCNVVLNWWVLFSKLLIVFCVGVFLVVFWFACRRIVKYFIQLSEEIQAMEGGDLDHPITIRGDDELTTLARCLDSMRVTLRQQQEEEAKASAKVKNLITEMSHDLRTPLTTRLLYTEIVRSRKYENDAQKDDYLNKIDTKARQLKQLSDNLFEYALVTRDTVVTLDPPAYFSRIFEEPLAEMVDTLQQRGFACALDLGSEDLMLTVKMQYIRRVFDNITSNAIKYADPGREISVTFRKEEKWVGLRFANHVLPGQHREESTQVGLTSIETMMEKMNAVCRVEQGTEQFAITLLFPIT